jgi:hypothetical protein
MQIERTLDVVEALLSSRGLGWHNTLRAIAYFCDPGKGGLLREICVRRGMPDLPVALAAADICRPELRFELELDAAGGAALPQE